MCILYVPVNNPVWFRPVRVRVYRKQTRGLKSYPLFSYPVGLAMTMTRWVLPV